MNIERPPPTFMHRRITIVKSLYELPIITNSDSEYALLSFVAQSDSELEPHVMHGENLLFFIPKTDVSSKFY